MTSIDKVVRILFVDDDEDERHFFTAAATTATEDNNIQVQVLKDGISMLELLRSKNFTLPHIVFLDIKMPDKTGLECLNELRKCSSCKNLPVAIYTNSTSESDVKDAEKLGADLFIIKPSTIPVLREVVKYTLSIDWTTRANDNKKLIKLGI